MKILQIALLAMFIPVFAAQAQDNPVTEDLLDSIEHYRAVCQAYGFQGPHSDLMARCIQTEIHQERISESSCRSETLIGLPTPNQDGLQEYE